MFRADCGPERAMCTRAISSNFACAGRRMSSLRLLSIDGLQAFAGFLHRNGWLSRQPGLLRRRQLCPEPPNFLPALKGFDTHDHQIALSIFSDINGGIFLMGQIRNSPVFISQSGRRLNNHRKPSLLLFR